jgi:hypothetical protein
MKRPAPLDFWLLAIAWVAIGTSSYGSEPIEVTPRLVDVRPIKYEATEQEGFALRVAFETKDGRIPNTVAFTVCTAIQGWELLYGENSWNCRNAPEMGYNCTRPKSNVETLYFGKYEYVLSEKAKRYYHPEPRPFDEIKRDLAGYIHVRAEHASVFSEEEMVEGEFCEALRQYEWAHPDENLSSGFANGLGHPHHQPDKPLTVLYWADLPKEKVERLRKLVERLAKEHKIAVAVEPGDRLFSGGFVPDPVESVVLPSRNTEASK